MSRFLIRAAACLAALLPAAGAPAADRSLGRLEYEQKCAMCHGDTGKGDGWFAKFLKSPPTSLTRLARDNGGVFPFNDVYQVIDGRKAVRVHGPRDMPVWGSVYREESGREYDPYYGLVYADEGVVRARILALIEYLSRLQE